MAAAPRSPRPTPHLAGGALLAALAAAGCAPAGGATAPMPTGGAAHVVAATPEAAGQYLTIVGGCNDCHTPGWDQSNGQTPPAEQMVGSPVGYRGPWGTSYAANLRLVAQRASEDRWVQILKTADGGHGLPPMPWMNTRQMSDADLRAMYRYIRSLGPAGQPTPRALPPGQEPTGPYIWMVPQGAGAAQ